MKEFRFGLTRRGLLTGTIPVLALLALPRKAGYAASPRRMEPQHWIDQQQELSDALATGQIEPSQWCSEVESLSAKVDIAELLVKARLSAEQASSGSTSEPDKQVVHFTDLLGRPQRLSYSVSLYSFRPDSVIAPHAHRNMVSAHLVAEGNIRIRTFDRVRDEKNGIVIKPAEDTVIGAGGISTMCAERHNIHWFVPQGGAATLLEVAIEGLSSQGAPSEITALDPLGGKKLRDGSLLAPFLGAEAAAAKYTAEL